MPVNSQEANNKKGYRPSKEDKEFLNDLEKRITFLKEYRAKLEANPYDNSPDSLSIEDTWDRADYLALPHKFSHAELEAWMADQSRPLVYAKIDTAMAIMIAKNPEAEIAARQRAYEKKTELMRALYNLSWDKGEGKQQLIKFIYAGAKYGTFIGREYHRYEEEEIDEVQSYDPVEGNHVTEKKTVIRHDDPYFESLPIRDVWLDSRARPYDEESMRDWFWEHTYDYSTFLKLFPEKKYPNAKYVNPSWIGEGRREDRDRADVTDDENNGPQVRLTFYENRENNEYVITDGHVLLYKAPLINNQLSLVVQPWRIRNDWTIYGVGLPEILENDQQLLDQVSNMTVNQLMLAIGGSGWYGGTGNITNQDMKLEPKLKKLRDADKIVFPKIPMPGPEAFSMLEEIRDEADDVSGVTKSLEGDQVGKTLGEAVLNREAGLRRLAIPLQNLQFALERHARLRIDNIQRIYSRPVESKIVVNELGTVVDGELFQEYQQERQRLGSESPEFINLFPEDDDSGVLYRNFFREERLPLQKTEDGEVEVTDQDQWLEITPEEIRGEYDCRIRAMSTIPVSQALEEARALETFQLVYQLPYTDLLKAQKAVLKARGDDPKDWMKTDEEIAQTQQMAQEAAQMGAVPEEGPAPRAPQPQQSSSVGNSFSKAFGQGL